MYCTRPCTAPRHQRCKKHTVTQAYSLIHSQTVCGVQYTRRPPTVTGVPVNISASPQLPLNTTILILVLLFNICIIIIIYVLFLINTSVSDDTIYYPDGDASHQARSGRVGGGDTVPEDPDPRAALYQTGAGPGIRPPPSCPAVRLGSCCRLPPAGSRAGTAGRAPARPAGAPGCAPPPRAPPPPPLSPARAAPVTSESVSQAGVGCVCLWPAGQASS